MNFFPSTKSLGRRSKRKVEEKVWTVVPRMNDPLAHGLSYCIQKALVAAPETPKRETKMMHMQQS